MSHQETLRDLCDNRRRGWLDNGVIALANDLAEGKGRLVAHFSQPEKREASSWLKYPKRDGMDPRAWKGIENSTCSERNDCLAHFIRLTGESQVFWIVATGFILSAILSALMRMFIGSTAKLLITVAVLVVVTGVVTMGIALASNSLLAFFVPYAFGLGGAGTLGASLLVSLLFKRPPKMDANERPT